MSYSQLLDELQSLKDEKYRDFQSGLITDAEVHMIGVRTPDLRRIAKRYGKDRDSKDKDSKDKDSKDRDSKDKDRQGCSSNDQDSKERDRKGCNSNDRDASCKGKKEEVQSENDSDCSGIAELLSYPDEWYEVKFIKLAAVAAMPYEEFVRTYRSVLDIIDNWALCDSFIPRCIKGNEGRFFQEIMSLITSGKEFYERFALVTLLRFYMEEEYLNGLFLLCEFADTDKKNVRTAAAWLIAEAAAKYYVRCKEYLLISYLDENTFCLAIRKACESLRLSEDEKTELKEIKTQWLSAKRSGKNSI